MLSVHLKATRTLERVLEAEVEDEQVVIMTDVGHLQITNTVDHADRPNYGNYKYIIQMEDGSVKEGRVLNHLRNQGAWRLVQKVLWDACFENGDKGVAE